MPRVRSPQSRRPEGRPWSILTLLIALVVLQVTAARAGAVWRAADTAVMAAVLVVVVMRRRRRHAADLQAHTQNSCAELMAHPQDLAPGNFTPSGG